MSEIEETTELFRDDILFVRNVRKLVRREMIGIDEVIDSLLVALVVGGHVLLEGNPGLGKTALIRSLHSALAFPENKTGRIQFTPDLMPSDITGTLMPSENDATRLAFKAGPIFTWLLLADEINRATPKTQAAMLEAMAEKQVTVLGESRDLVPLVKARLGRITYTIRPPFMVMATQNPIDQEGTYNLPEAQADRFMFKIRMPFPSDPVLRKIVEKELQPETPPATNVERKSAELDNNSCEETLIRLARLSRGVRAAEGDALLSRHIRNILLASNGTVGENMGLSARRQAEIREFVETFVRFPLGPRAAFAMELGARGLAAVLFVDPDLPETLADHTPAVFSRLCIPAIRHRLKLRLGWERLYRPQSDDAADGTDRLQDRLLGDFVLMCAPEDGNYAANLEQSLAESLKNPI